MHALPMLAMAGASANVNSPSSAHQPSAATSSQAATCAAALAASGQIDDLDTLIPHYNTTRHTIIAHVHVGKMAGRSVITDFPSASGLRFCSFQGDPLDTWKRQQELVPVLSKHCGAEQRCLFIPGIIFGRAASKQW